MKRVLTVLTVTTNSETGITPGKKGGKKDQQSRHRKHLCTTRLEASTNSETGITTGGTGTGITTLTLTGARRRGALCASESLSPIGGEYSAHQYPSLTHGRRVLCATYPPLTHGRRVLCATYPPLLTHREAYTPVYTLRYTLLYTTCTP